MPPPLERWIDGQYRHSADQLLRSISCGIVKERPGFGQAVRAAPGSIVASPIPGSYDPDPDYFFHWYRDAAVVIEALRLLYLDDPRAAAPGRLFGEFIDFSLRTLALDGRALATGDDWRGRVQEPFRRYLRPAEELARVHGAAVRGETRLNPDGTLDISRWPRPQHDGIALRAVVLQRWLRDARLSGPLRAAVGQLLAGDLDYTLGHWQEPCHDIWEEECGLHYYTLLASAAALAGREEQARILARLDDFWDAQAGCYRSRSVTTGEARARDPDVSVLLAAIHTDLPAATHSVADPRQQATLERLEAVFARTFAINRDRPPGHAPALGRYENDAYYGGGAWFVATLGAAEFCYRAAPRLGAGWIGRGDGFLATARRFTPADGALAEQFDRDTGEPRSARQLTWSHAAFITCTAARRRALAAA